MKAKEYAKKFNAGEMTAKEIYVDFRKTYAELFNVRHIITRKGIVSLVKELNTKWNAMASMTTEIAKDGFVLLLVKEIPELLDSFVVEFPKVDFGVAKKEDHKKEQYKIDGLTEEQIENWRGVLMNIFGISIKFMSDEEIIRIANVYQQKFNEDDDEK